MISILYRHVLGIVALLIASTGGVFANGMRLVSQDAFAASRGEAFVATADNPSAIYYNPAGITQLEGSQLRFGANLLYYDPTFQPPAGQPNSTNTYHINRRAAAAPQLYFTHSRESSPITAGVGVYAPYGGAVEWSQDTGFRTVGIEGELLYLRVNPVIAYKVTPTLSVAGGVLLDYSELKQRQGIRPPYQPFNNYFQFEGEGWNAGWNLGVLWQASEKLSFGATFRSTTRIHYRGDTEVLVQPVTDPAFTTGGDLTYDFPMTAVLGLSYRPTPKWNIEFNVDYTDWSSFDTLTLYQDQQPPSGVQQVIPVNLQWDASWMFALGVTHYFGDGWHVSGGYLFNQNSVPDDYYSPLVADLDRHFFSLGTGYRGDRWTFDIAYQLGYGPPHTVSGSQAPSRPSQIFGNQNGDGTYDWISHAILISVGRKF